MTQRLLALIDESNECRNANEDSLPNVIEQIVKEKILYGSDANLIHLIHYLRNSGDSYCHAVSTILWNKPEEQSEKGGHHHGQPEIHVKIDGATIESFDTHEKKSHHGRGDGDRDHEIPSP